MRTKIFLAFLVSFFCLAQPARFADFENHPWGTFKALFLSERPNGYLLLLGGETAWENKIKELLANDAIADLELESRIIQPQTKLAQDVRAMNSWGESPRWVVFRTDGSVLDHDSELPNDAQLWSLRLQNSGYRSPVFLLTSFLRENPDSLQGREALVKRHYKQAKRKFEKLIDENGVLKTELTQEQDTLIFGALNRELRRSLENQLWQWMYGFSEMIDQPALAQSPIIKGLGSHIRQQSEEVLLKNQRNAYMWNAFLLGATWSGRSDIAPLLAVPPLPTSSSYLAYGNPSQFAKLIVAEARKNDSWELVVSNSMFETLGFFYQYSANQYNAPAMERLWQEHVSPILEAQLRLKDRMGATGTLIDYLVWSGATAEKAIAIAKACNDDQSARDWEHLNIDQYLPAKTETRRGFPGSSLSMYLKQKPYTTLIYFQETGNQGNPLVDRETTDNLEMLRDFAVYTFDSPLFRDLSRREGWERDNRWVILDAHGRVDATGTESVTQDALKGHLASANYLTPIQRLESFLIKYPDRVDARAELLFFQEQVANNITSKLLQPLSPGDDARFRQLAKPMTEQEDEKIWGGVARGRKLIASDPGLLTAMNQRNFPHSRLSPLVKEATEKILPVIESWVLAYPAELRGLPLWGDFVVIADADPTKLLLNYKQPPGELISPMLAFPLAVKDYLIYNKRWDVVETIYELQWELFKHIPYERFGSAAAWRGLWGSLLAPLMESLIRQNKIAQADEKLNEILEWTSSNKDLLDAAVKLATDCGAEKLAAKWEK